MKNAAAVAGFLMIGLALTFSIPAQGQAALAPGREQNAAIKYLRADAALRQSYPLPLDAWVGLEAALNRPLDGTDEKVVASATEALTEFGHGADIAKCDWEMSVEDGALASTSHRGAIRELAAVSLLRARIRLRDGRTRQAVEDIFASYAAARHLSWDGSIASVLFGYRIEREVSRVLEGGLSIMSSSDLDYLQSRLATLPESARMHSALEREKLDRNDLLAAISGARTRNDVVNDLLARVPFLKGDRRAAEKIVDGCGGSVAGLRDCIERESDFYKKWASRLDLAPEQFQEQYEADFAQASVGNPVLAAFTPPLARLRWAEAYNDTRRALLKAAIAVERDGTKELARYPDPTDGRLFEYSQSADGFRLESQLRQDGKPISISVQRGKRARSSTR